MLRLRSLGVAATPNYAVSVTNKDDDGFHRRTRIWQTTQTFRAKPQKLTEHKADDTLKARILKGEFNSQLLWLLRGLWASLDSAVNPGTTLLPIPELMKELETLSAGGGSQDALLSWIAGCCEPVDRKNATKIQDFKKAAADRLGVCLMQIGPILTAAGINPQCVSNAIPGAGCCRGAPEMDAGGHARSACESRRAVATRRGSRVCLLAKTGPAPRQRRAPI